MIQAALVLGLLSVAVPSDPKIVTPVSIVDDKKELRRGLKANGVKFDDVFVAAAADGEAARRALRPYLESEIVSERHPDRKTKLSGILKHIADYDWHCGGFIERGQRSLFCAFDRGIVMRAPGKYFPVIADGGISVCRCVFRLREQRIESLEWNGEA